MAYTRGNLAVKEQSQPGKSTKTAYREQTMVVTRRTYLPVKEKLLYLFTVVVCVMVSSLIIWQNANIYGLNKESQTVEVGTNRAKADIKKLTAQKQALEVGVREKAIQMGFQEPNQKSISVSRASHGKGSQPSPTTAKK